MTANKYTGEQWDDILQNWTWLNKDGSFNPEEVDMIRCALRLAKAISAIPYEDRLFTLNKMQSSHSVVDFNGHTDNRADDLFIDLLTASLETE